MLKITPTLSIPRSELTYDYIRASGPGGQNINKVATAVQLRFSIRTSSSLTEEIKFRLAKLTANKLNHAGELVIKAKRYRTQDLNRMDADQRLASLIRKVLTKPIKRVPTHPSLASKARRIDSKKRKGKIKNLRKTYDD